MFKLTIIERVCNFLDISHNFFDWFLHTCNKWNVEIRVRIGHKSRQIIFEFFECIGYKVDSMWRFIWFIFFTNFHFSWNLMIEFGSIEAIVIFNYFYERHVCWASRISTPFSWWMEKNIGEIICSWKKYLNELRDYFSKKYIIVTLLEWTVTSSDHGTFRWFHFHWNIWNKKTMRYEKRQILAKKNLDFWTSDQRIESFRSSNLTRNLIWFLSQ